MSNTDHLETCQVNGKRANIQNNMQIYAVLTQQ